MSGTEALPEAEAHDHSHADVSGGWLRAHGIPTTIRDTRGQDIDGACGQLAAATA